MQVLLLHVEGTVLTPDQFRAGDYVLPSELPLCRTLREQGDWTAQSTSQAPNDNQVPGNLKIACHGSQCAKDTMPSQPT